jgi:tetratricopeptide (TPR) repeat protein
MSGDSPAKKDANDYSRFENMSDDESDIEASIPTSDEESDREPSPQTFHENLVKSMSLKESGNSAFKLNNLEEAMRHYEEAIELLKPLKKVRTPHPEIPHEKFTEMKATYVSVLSNSCMVSFKEERWTHVISTSNEVLLEEEHNVKALYRRSVAHHRTGYLEESKEGLTKVIELDASNAAAKKELIEVIKSIKEKKQRERASLSSAFSNGSMYSDREAERQKKLRKAQEEEDRLQDEWIKDKLKRRKEGDDEEISFDDWKKKKQKAAEDEKKRIEKEEKAKRKAAASSSATAGSSSSSSSGSANKAKKAIVKKDDGDDEDVYDEEDK